MCKKMMLAGVAAITLLAGQRAAFAQALCTTTTGPCASLPQQLLDYARQAEQLVQEVNTATNTLNIDIQEITNTLKLPGTVYRDLTGDIAQIEAIRSTASLLIGFSGRL